VLPRRLCNIALGHPLYNPFTSEIGSIRECGFAVSHTSRVLSVSARKLSAIMFSDSPTGQSATMAVVFIGPVNPATNRHF
jgi:hypothetical protein